jgi:cobalt-zinc-cadmium efflux system membrane fusion protein
MKNRAPVQSQPSRAARPHFDRVAGSPHGRTVRPLCALRALGLAPLLGLVLANCSHHATDAQSNSTSSAGAVSGEDKAQLFTVPEKQMQHLQVVTVETQRLPRVLRLTGSVAYNNFETTPVITQVGGPVARIVVSPGDLVRRGQPMLYVASPDYAQARTNYLKARDALWLAEKSYARAQDLYAHRAIAEADLQQTESARNQAQADLEAAEQAMRVLGVNPDDLTKAPVSAEIPVLAPLAGEVVERLVGPGQVLQAGATQAFTISNTSTVWVLANVYEHDLASVRLGDPVAIQTDAYPTAFHGKISYIAPALDLASRTLQVRIVTDNPGRKLKKDMYVTATVQAGQLNTLAVPDAAVLRTPENQPFVYVEVDPSQPSDSNQTYQAKQFGQRPVEIGDSQNGKTAILNGLRAGEQVVADGSLFLQFANSLQR